MAEVEWSASNDYSREDTNLILEQIEQQVEQQTDESVQVWEVEELEAVSGGFAVTFVLGAASSLVAEAIYDALKDRDETKNVENMDFEIDQHGDGEINIDITIEED